MAQAVQHLFPRARFGIGPALENGWYYDIKADRPLTTGDFDAIEAEMKKIIKADLPVEKRFITAEEGRALFAGQDYKLELLEEYAEKGWQLSIYTQGDFTDLCAGPHLMSTGALKAVKLLKVAAAYWRGDAQRDSLDRLYGIAFPKASQLEEYLKMLEEAQKRDHRRLGKELELFTLMEEGPGFPFFLPKGMILKNELIDYWRQIHRAAGYQEISTPVMLNRALWERSGHWDHYKKNMYTTVIDDTDFAIKPMNCPGGMLVYQTKPRSYRDLPLRMGELGLVHRHELSGALHGLMRVRCFTQDDAHIFMTPEQIKDEIKGVVKLIDQVYSLFGFEYHIELSTMPEDHLGDEAAWQHATDGLRGALREDPDVILLGELRDSETIRLALTAAETSHLVLATLHTRGAAQAVERLVDVFPADEQNKVRSQLAGSLKAVLAQKLVADAQGGRTALHELLINTPAVANLIREGKTHQLPGLMETGQQQGMQTFAQSVAMRLNEGRLALQKDASAGHWG